MSCTGRGVASLKEVSKVSEKSWGTNGLVTAAPPVGCCLDPGVLWELNPNVGSQRQFFQSWSHQFLSEGSPSNVLPHCCAVTCVNSQFIALWAGSFYHERFLSASFSPSPGPSLPLSFFLAPLCSALFAAAEVLWRDHSIDTMLGHNSQGWLSSFIMYWNLFLSTLWAPPSAGQINMQAAFDES